MLSLKRRVAAAFRRIANAIDSPRVLVDATPLAFIATAELAKEIRQRNDISVIFWARDVRAPEGRFVMQGHCYWRVPKERLVNAMVSIANTIGKREFDDWEPMEIDPD